MFVSQGLKRVRSNGMGVHTAEEIETFGKKDLLTLSEMLGEKEFFFGSEPAMLDLVVFSQVGQLVMVDSEHACPLRDYLEADCKNLVALSTRMKDRCWADHWDAATGEEMDLNPHIPKVSLDSQCVMCGNFKTFHSSLSPQQSPRRSRRRRKRSLQRRKRRRRLSQRRKPRTRRRRPSQRRKRRRRKRRR